MDRRGFLGVLAFAGVVGLTGCSSSTPGPSPTGSGATPQPGDDDELRHVTFAAEQELVGKYATAIAGAQPELAERLRTIQAQHIEHAQRLRPEIPVSTDPPTPTPAVTPSPTMRPVVPSAHAASPTVSVGPGLAPGATGSASPTLKPAAVLTVLRQAEEAALAQRGTACEHARDAGLARSLCLIAASEGQHVDQLRLWRSELSR